MNRICIALLLAIFAVGSAIGQGNLNKPVPMNKAVRYGKLSNGITYYIYHNEMPKDRASFYIVQNVGALMEEDNQNGLAHFLEHMAFNGTKHFPGKGVINTLEKHGVTFGGNINAYTAKNETVYNLSSVPTNKKGLVDTCLLVLHDWANGLSLETKEIDAERGVITEEWRQRRNAQFRVMNKIAPALYNNSKYAYRDVIGSLDVIKNFKPETIKKFYHDWYRSDLQCIIVSGDVDVNETEEKIKALFSQIPVVDNAKPREFHTIDDNETTQYCLATDKELQHTNISLYIRHRATEKEKINHQTVRDAYVTSLFNTMVANRISELMRKEETPFLNAGISYGGLVRGYESYTLTVIPKVGKDTESFKKLMEINKDILDNGFRNDEFLMAKTNMLVGMESYYKQKDKRNNESFVQECKSHYLYNNPMPGIDYSYKFFKKQINSITPKDIKEKAKHWFTDKNRVLIVTGPEKEGITFLSKDDLLSVISSTESTNIISKAKENLNVKLFDTKLAGGKITKTEKLNRFAAESWTLSNGAKVVYKYCNFNPGVVSFKASSLGGMSLIADKDLPSASSLNSMLMAYGLGNHDFNTLKKLMTGKQVGVGVKLSELGESISGKCKQSDFETMLQMVYMFFEQPRFDKKAHDLIISRSLDAFKGIKKNYGQILQDSVNMIVNSYHPRVRIYNEDYIKDIDISKMEEIYRDRFQDASDFTFYIVGDISKKKVKKFVSKYIGSIPSINRKETYKNLGSTFPKGKTEKEIALEMAEPKSGAIITYNYPLDFDDKDIYCFNFLSESLKLRFTEEIREKEGGTYGVNVAGAVRRFPEGNYNINIQFQCDPARVKELKAKVYAEIDKIIENGIPEADFKKTLSTLRKMHAQKVKNNAYWMGILNSFIEDNEDHTSKKYFEDIINNMTLKDIHDFAKNFFGGADLVDIIFKPKEN